jgi:hypothetical protein
MQALLIFLLFGIASCRLSDSYQVDTYRINEILDDIQEGVLLYNTDKIFKHIHPDFLHNGYYARDIRSIWEMRVVNYSLLKLENREIKVGPYYATVKMRMTLSSVNVEKVSEEPSTEFGDLSYFIYEKGEWSLYGNQRYIPE